MSTHQTRGRVLYLKSFVGDDLDPETGQSLVVMHRGGEIDDRRDAKIPQDLRADADLAPLLVAISLRRLRLPHRLHGNTGRSVAQINQHPAACLLEVLQHDLHPRLTSEEVLDD